MDVSKLSDEDLQHIVSAGSQPAKPDALDFSKMSDDQLKAIAGGDHHDGVMDHFKRMFSPSPEQQAADKQATMDAIKKQGEVAQVGTDSTLNELALGHLPQIKAKLGQVLSGEGISNDENYVRRRDQEIADEKAGADKYPGAHAIGKAEGFAIPLLATMGGSAPASIAKGVAPSLLKRIAVQGAKGAATGFAMGAAQNPGDQAGVVDPLQASERIDNGVSAAKVGGAIGVGAAALPSIAAAADRMANTKAFKAAGAMLKDFRKATDKGTLEETGQFMFDNGLVKAGDDYSSIADRADKLRGDTGAELGKGYEAAKKILPQLGPGATAKVEAAGFNPVRDKGEILKAVADQLKNSPERKSVISHVSNYLDDLAETHGDKVLNPQAANEIKSKLDQVAINWERNPLAREPEKEAGYKALRQFLGDKVSGQVQAIGDAIGSPDAAANLADLNKKYGIASRVSAIAKDRVGREEAKSAFGLGHMGATGIGTAIGTAVGGPVGAAVGGTVGYGANYLGSHYGPAVIASGAKTAAKVAGAIPKVVGALARTPGAGEAFVDQLPARAVALPAANSKELDRDSSRSSNFQEQKQEPKPSPTPQPKSKGPDKWASDGFDKVVKHDPSLDLDRDQLMKNQKAKSLLIMASDLKPGSKAMEVLIAKLKSQGKAN